ncbi:polysaccharide pyruvyl transferase family protein [Thalassovita sp.]|uniref:polysaccharide pyruvyl transferase family protein n=1 Tax=Thalassovita sp. TaxID=1979401 RepID=UPI0029DE8E18|nr:polysaccharide pyruvyl transferase family protein [Thalassovita sp.]
MPSHPTVIVMNDTSTRYHHGCARVMRLLSQGLEAAGLMIIARSPARHDWENDPDFLQAVQQADLIVINGEGTLHHGKPAGEALLRIATHPARGNTPVALVNALYQDNPPEWGALLAQFSLLSARDSQSATSMARASHQQVRWLPDLSLSAPAETPAHQRKGLIVGDSVRLDKRRDLARLASQTPGARFIPTKTLRHAVWHLPLIGPFLRGVLFRLYNAVFPLHAPEFLMPMTEGAYLAEIAAAQLHITGRFHAVCLSMLTETPFLALTSNASKIEQLLRDAGLDGHRIVSVRDISAPPASADFSDQELKLIRAFRTRAQQDADRLYRDLADLARTHRDQPSTSAMPRPAR